MDKSDSLPDDLTSKELYMESYAHFGMHETLLKDHLRTKVFKQAILHNKHLFRNKIVLDLGCGTGILSMFAAKAGAAKVIAIESSAIIHSAREIIKANNFSDVIHLIHSKVEDVTSLPDSISQVDVILCDWIGYCVFYDSMINAVVHARDKWLKPGGVIMPDKLSLFMSGIEDVDYKEDKVNFWRDVYSFDLSAMRRCTMMEPLVDVVDSKHVCTTTHRLLDIDMNVVKMDELLPGQWNFSLRFTRDDMLHALVLFFSVEFSRCHRRVGFTTGPNLTRCTHWKQTVFYLEGEHQEFIKALKDEQIQGLFQVIPRSLSPNNCQEKPVKFIISFTFQGAFCKEKKSLEYLMK